MLTKVEQCSPSLSLSVSFCPLRFFAVMFAIKIASVTRFGTRQGSRYVRGCCGGAKSRRVGCYLLLYRKLMCLPQIPFSGSAHFSNGTGDAKCQRGRAQ